MSISAALASFEWQDRKINLIDTPGDPSFVADALGSLRVCESAVFVVNAVMGVEVSTQRLWARAADLDIARLIHVNMLDRERADFFRTLDQLKACFGPHVVATEIPIGSEQDVRGLIDLVDMKAFEYSGDGRENCIETAIPDDMADLAVTYREKLMDEVAEVSESLMERYLEGEDISHDEIVGALKEGTNHGDIFPVACGVATRNLGTNRLLDAIVEDLPSPVKHGGMQAGEVVLEPVEDAELFAYIFKTKADPFAGRLNFFRVYQGVIHQDMQVLNTRAHAKERIGQLLVFSGARNQTPEHVTEFGPGDIGAVAKLKDTRAGDWLASRDEPITMPAVKLPAPVMAFAIAPKNSGDEDKVFTALRRLQEEDPTIDLHRDPQTGEEIVAGLTQIHVEVVVDRLRSRFGVEVDLRPPRVPYQETIRGRAEAHGRHKKQTGGRGQFGDCHIEIEPLGDGADLEFVNHIKGGVIPTGFIPAVEKGIREAMAHGPDCRLSGEGRPRDSSSTAATTRSIRPNTPSGRRASSRCAKRSRTASPMLLEPIMMVTLSVPEESVGDVIGDLNSRRGRPQGMEPIRRDDRGQGRGPDGRDADLRAGPAVADGGSGRLHDGVRAVRRSACTSGAEGRRGGRHPERGCERLSHAGRCYGSRSWSARRSRRTRPWSPVTSVVARCCAGRTPTSSSTAVRGAPSASCAPSRAMHEGWIREGLDNALGRTGERSGARSLLGRLRSRRVERQDEPSPSRRRRRRLPPLHLRPRVLRPALVADGRGYVVEPEASSTSAVAVASRTMPVAQRRRPARATTRSARATPRQRRADERRAQGRHGRWRSSIRARTPAPSPASPGRSARRWSLPGRRRPRAASSRSSSAGSSAGTATSSTSPMRPPGVRLTGQGGELAELATDDQSANATADDHGELHPLAAVA